MKFIHRPKNPKRGVAIELAINVMVVAVALGGLLLTIAVLQRHQTNMEARQFESKLELMQIGEDLIAAVKNDPSPQSIAGELEAKYADTDYRFEIAGTDGGAISMAVREGEEEDVVLDVELTPEGGSQYKITKWK